MKLFQSKSSQETDRLLVQFNHNVIDAHAKVNKLGKLMRDIESGECPLFPCYVGKDGYLSLKKKIANGKY